MLPTSIGRLKQLRCLIAPRMKNDNLPECVTELSKLQYLNINGSSKITELPESIGNLGCLKYLCLSGCSDISKLPESFGDLKCMVHLDMSGCSDLTELPGFLGNLTNLQHLDLSGNSSVKAIPEPLCHLTQLKYLNLSSCKCLDQLPEAFGSLLHLRYLNMSGCGRIRELPESLIKLQNLLHLDVSDCSSMQHLGGVRGLTTLQHLDMSGLQKVDVQDFRVILPNLTNLKYLSFSSIIWSSKENFVIEYICRFTNLEHLDLSVSLGLTSLPETISNLQRLHTLDISNCHDLVSLPESIGTLRLKSLVLKGCRNELVDLASSLVNYSQTLPLFMVRADELNGCSNLGLLEGVHHVSELRIRSLENVKSLEEANKVKLSDKHNLLDLTLTWNSWTVEKVQNLKCKDLLEQLVPPRGLRSMCLEGYSCTSFPDWIMCIYHHLTNLVSIKLSNLPTCTNLPPLGQLPNLEKLELFNLPSIKRIDREFCGGKGTFSRLSSFELWFMEGLQVWNTTYSVEDGVEEFMFPVLDRLVIEDCPSLRLKPCPPTFREGIIKFSEEVISSLEEVDETSRQCCTPSRAIKLYLWMLGDFCQSIKLFHHFPALSELSISGSELRSVPESTRHLTSLESLKLEDLCGAISALPEWLGDLSSLKSLIIVGCSGIKSLPACIQQLTKLQTLEIRRCPELKKWCESEENKTKLAHIDDVRLSDDYW